MDKFFCKSIDPHWNDAKWMDDFPFKNLFKDISYINFCNSLCLSHNCKRHPREEASKSLFQLLSLDSYGETFL